MARGFGSTYGAGTTDRIIAAYSTAPASQISISVWIWINGLGGSSLGRVISQRNQAGGSTNFILGVKTNTLTMRFVQYWNGSPAYWTFPVTPSAWQHICVTYDGSSTSNAPVAYVNGVSQTVTVGSAPSGSRNANSITIGIGNDGGGSGTSSYWDGMIAEAGYWNGLLLTASEAKALSKGLPPLFVRPSQLSLYCPLLGLGSGEPDWGPARVSQTLTGTKFQNHAPATFWMPPATIAPVSRIAGTLALQQGAATTAIGGQEKFKASLASMQAAASAALGLREKFVAAAGILQPASSAAVAAGEKFSAFLSLLSPANEALLYGHGLLAFFPGSVAVTDAAQANLVLGDEALGELALADAALYDVQMTETI